MKIKPKYKQVNCNETDKLDLRQARAVLKFKPDMIILEYPNDTSTPGIELNNYSPFEKPKDLIEERLKPLSDQVLNKHPWAQSDLYMWQNIAKLWSEGKQVLVYQIDGPSELTSEWLEVWAHMYPCSTKNWVWWVQIYLRERLMANNMQRVLDEYKTKSNPRTLVFVQNEYSYKGQIKGLHWGHVEYLLGKPSKEDIWQYYFGAFSKEVTRNTIAQKIKKLNPVFYSYWQRYSDFNQD
jgi:hypothetical protein